MPQADGNVPFIGPRARYSVVNETPTLLVHQMAYNATPYNFNAVLPRTAALVSTALDPVVAAGNAQWTDLTAGGLFPFGGRALWIDALFGRNCTPAWTIIDSDGNIIRPTPATPFRLNANERLAAVTSDAANAPGNVSGAAIGAVVKIYTDNL